MSNQLIRIFDTTLRDGEQSPGCSMNLEEKLQLARQLESSIAGQGYWLETWDEQDECVLDQLRADVGHRSQADRENDRIEVLPDFEPSSTHGGFVPVRLVVDAPELLSVADQLRSVRPRRPAGKAVDVDQRRVLTATLDLRLDPEVEGSDVRGLSGEILQVRQLDVLVEPGAQST